MRLLKFNVNAQRIQKDPACDFSNIAPGSKGYLRAQFTFSHEWHDCTIVASFWRGKDEHAVFVTDGVCDIPTEALVGPTYRVSLIGRRGDYEITTNKLLVRQEVSG